MKTYVYKITRLDGKEYIGITPTLRKRFKCHEKNKRFSMGIIRFAILKKCDTYEEAGKIEEKMIKHYDTFYNGLNRSINGKGNHLSSNFTTKGFKFSEESKKKMSENNWSKRGYPPPMLGKKFSQKTKRKFSDTRKGFVSGPRKISLENRIKIYKSYKYNSLHFSNEFLSTLVKISQKEDVRSGIITDINEMIFKNGKKLNLCSVYSIWYANKFSVTAQNIKHILLSDGNFAPDITDK